MNSPVITTSFDLSSDSYRLMATSFLKTEPAGDRLFRGGEYPAVSYVHDDADTAELDRAKLQSYCDLAWQGKAPKARGKEEKVEKVEKVVDTAMAVWNL